MTPDPLTAALTCATLAVAALVVAFAKRQLRNGKSAPAPPVAAKVTDTGSYITIPALIGEQMALHVRPILERLDRIERKQDDTTDRANDTNERLARIEGALES